jgi:hypothetical protein
VASKIFIALYFDGLFTFVDGYGEALPIGYGEALPIGYGGALPIMIVKFGDLG